MPTIDENQESWGKRYDWSESGDEWSSAWGGAAFMWTGTIMPRIQAFLPAEHVLEIAPGFGRCTRYLKDLCAKLTIVDLNERCIEECRRRFESSPNIDYVVNDGRSLEAIRDHDVDLVFSWDSLVHAEMDVIECYIAEFARVLKPGGYGFIHHSNMARYAERGDDVPGWRAPSVSAELFSECCRENGLSCVVQEPIVLKPAGPFVDCLSLFVASPGHEGRCVENHQFPLEVGLMSAVSHLVNAVSSLYLPVDREGDPAAPEGS